VISVTEQQPRPELQLTRESGDPEEAMRRLPLHLFISTLLMAVVYASPASSSTQLSTPRIGVS
jgi:hypothetical protein